MFRFSCLQALGLSPKQKKKVHLSSVTLPRDLDDPSKNQCRRNFSYPAAKNQPCLKEDGDTSAGCRTDSFPTEHDCRSEEIENKYKDYDIAAYSDNKMKKSLFLGSELNWKKRISAADGSEEEVEQLISYDGSVSCSVVCIQDGISNQEPMSSDSMQVNCDFAKVQSILSIGDIEKPEKESSYRDDVCFFGAGDSGDAAPHTPPIFAIPSSLPSLSSLNQISTPIMPCSRSSEDVIVLDCRKKSPMHESGTLIEREERDYSIFNNKNTGENSAKYAYESYNYVGLDKDWMVTLGVGREMEENTKGETSFQNWNEVSPKNLRLKRIQEWVIDLQQCIPLEDSDEITPSVDHDLPKGDALVEEEQTAAKAEAKINPGMEAAKRYISSLSASDTAAQLTNLGLVVIPFLSASCSLKSLNLSGNEIVRITAGALPKGLHILNLSKNNLSSIEGLRDLTRLRVLDLSYNRILRIGHGLSSCSSLKELYLSGNKISEVEGLHRLLKLNLLDLRFNKISTNKCLGQLAANYNCLQALSLEGNPVQKNVGEEQLKKYVQNHLPNLTHYNRKSLKTGSSKDTADRSTRLGSIGAHQSDRGIRVEAKTSRKGTHGIDRRFRLR